MLYIGLFFILMGLFLILDDIIDVRKVIKNEENIRKENFVLDNYYKLKAAIGVFSIVVGVLSLINYYS